MFTLFAFFGRAAAPFLLSLVPGFSPKLVMYGAAVFAVLMAIGAPAGAVWLHMRGEVKKAEVARDLHWTLELQKANKSHDEKLAAALQAAEAEQPISADRAERLRQCKGSSTCRDRRR
jgi:hypothetical protein